MAELNTDIRYVKGVGEARAKAFQKLGITTLGELVMHYPRAYEDRTHFKTIGELIPGENACVIATVASTPTLRYVRKGVELVKFRVVDATRSMNITYFNQSYMKDAFKVGEGYVFFGRVGGTPGRPEMLNPVFDPEEEVGGNTGRLVPIYPLTAGLSQKMISKAMRSGLDSCGELLPDPLPKGVREKYQLAQSRYTYENIHFPKDQAALELARRRLIFEEFFVLACTLNVLKGGRNGTSGHRIDPNAVIEFYKLLPFNLTGAQQRSIEEALSDMAGGNVMSRLIQGDVGSGKTMVAAACIWCVSKSGYQAAMMAPTEILAEQHYQNLSRLFEPQGITVGLLSGSMTAKQRREMRTRIASGEVHVVVGTHALISEDVVYANLGLVVADEQHRFGVQQRTALSDKGEHPHVLVMSATPIPRTLALIMYGDLSVSIIDELPPGRRPVETYAVGEKMRPRIQAFLRKLIEQGRQAYIVCPAVEENEDTPNSGLHNVKEYTADLQKNVFPELEIAFIHGKMRQSEKDKIMSRFAGGEIHILVSTTVIEVGVDVPNAAVMVVENADRFGLSQLHQLRGRVGRGQHQSYCILFEGAGGGVSEERLKTLCRTTDGFEIAEEDLKLRGPGDFFGSRQHGLPEMKLADFATDVRALQIAQRAAMEVMAADPDLRLPENQELRRSVERNLNAADTI